MQISGSTIDTTKRPVDWLTGWQITPPVDLPARDEYAATQPLEESE
jgi:hypothetical protein